MRVLTSQFHWLVLFLITIRVGSAPVEGHAQSPVNDLAGPGTLTLRPIITKGLVQPLYLTHAGDGSGRLFIVEQAGRIRVLAQGNLHPTPFLDISDRVWDGGERGLLGLAFHPDYSRNGRLFVSYTRQPDGATVVAEYGRGSRSDHADRQERIVLTVPQPFANHNGGMIAFGPDGALYIGRGDGGSRGDPNDRGQNPHDLLGKILRLDVNRGDPYAIPADNPFVAGEGRPEVYALGLRNPWRFSFDRKTGFLLVGDVGQYAWEEVDLVVRSGNYGWRLMEGLHCFTPATDCQRPGLILPIVEYGHDGGRCSITGGYVYRGSRQPALQGMYLYGDYCSGEIFGARVEEEMTTRSKWNATVLLRAGLRISSFGEDEAGEIYVVDHGGGIYQVDSSR